MLKKIITCWGVKSGVGTTMNSIFLAKRLSELNFKVLLIDLNFKNPDLYLYLNSSDTLHDLNNVLTYIISDNMNEELLLDNTQKIKFQKKEGFDFLRGIKDLSTSVKNYVNELEKMFKYLDNIYDYIILDCANDVNNAGTYFALKNSDLNLFIIDNNVNTVRQYSFLKDFIDEQVSKEKNYLVMNKTNGKVELNENEVFQFLNFYNKEIYKIPTLSDELLLHSINQGDLIQTLIKNNKEINNLNYHLDLLIKDRINSEIEITTKKSFSFFK